MANLANLKKSVDLQKSGTTGTDLLNKPKGITPGTIGTQGAQLAAKTTPKPATNTAANLKRSEAEFPRTQPEGTTYNPYQALQNRQPGDAPISPYVGSQTPPDVTPPATPSMPSTKITPGSVAPTVDTSSSMAQATADLTPGTEEMIGGYDKLFDIASELKDEKITSYEELHTRNIETLNQLQEQMEALTAQKNALVTSSAEVQNLEIQAAYDANAEALRIAKERLAASQRQVLSEREKQLERKKINEENMLALIGGFGSMAGNKMLIDSVEEGEQAMGVLKTEYSFQDQEHTSRVVALNNNYKNDKLKIEQWKQETILQNYENLQGYIEKIVRDEMMSDQDKVKAINAAKDQYNNTISQLHQDVISARFELSRDILDRSDQLRAEFEAKTIRDKEMARQDIGDARADLTMLAENYALENFDTLSSDVKAKIAEIEKKADLPAGFTEQAIKNFKAQNAGQDMQIRFEKDDQGNLTIIGVDKKTGLVAATSQVLGAGTTKTGPKATQVTASAWAGVGDKKNPSFDQCGHFSNNATTGKKVGDLWETKISQVDKKDNPTKGDTGVIPVGLPYGHTFVVMQYFPDTGVIQTVERNKNNDGKTTYGSYNLNDLQAQYGENFGFISGELKKDYGATTSEFDSEPDTPQEPTAAPEPKTTNYDEEFADF